MAVWKLDGWDFLDALPGERFWFRFRTDPTGRRSSLLVAPQSGPPLGPPPDGGRSGLLHDEVTGLLTVAPSGTFVFHTTTPSPLFLVQLARWVARSVPDFPPLAQLAGARHCVRLKDEPPIEHILDELWIDVLPDDVNASEFARLRVAEASLRRAHACDDHWLWFGSARDLGSFLLLKPTETTPLEAFTDEIVGLVGTLPRVPKSGHGILTWEGEVPSIRVSGDCPNFLPPLADWIRANLQRAPELGRLRGARLVRPDGETLEDADAWEGLPPSPRTANLSMLAALEECLGSATDRESFDFWFAPRGPHGTPSLVLRRPDEEGAPDFTHVTGPDAVSGSARYASQGGLRFQSDTVCADFLVSLAAFVYTNAGLAPQLRKLRGSAFRAVGADETVLDMQRDDTLWQAL